MSHIDHAQTQEQVGTMLADRPPVITTTLIGEHTSRTEHLHYRNEQQQHEYHPHDFVATKYSIQKIHRFDL
jgi:hypothetical protein